MKTHRLARVAEVIREVASETILFELRDPRVKGVTVTRAEVSGDLQHAKVYVSRDGHAEGAGAVHARPAARGRLRPVEAGRPAARRASRR